MVVLRASAVLVALSLVVCAPPAAAAQPQSATGAVWLGIGQSLNGVALAFEGAAIGREWDLFQVVGLLSVPSAWVSAFAWRPSTAQAAAVNAGSLLGAMHILALCPGGDSNDFKMLLAGQLVGTAAGIGLALTDPDHQRVATANSLAFWAGALVYEIRMANPGRDNLYVGVLAADLGWAFGYAAAPDLDLSPGTLAGIDLAVAGAWTAGVLYNDAAGSDRNKYTRSVAVAAGVGVGLGLALARPWEDRPLTLMPTANGLAVAGQF